RTCGIARLMPTRSLLRWLQRHTISASVACSTRRSTNHDQERQPENRTDARVQRWRCPVTGRRQLVAPAAPAEPCADVECLFCTLNDHLGKADAFITTAEDQMERPRSGDGAEDLRRRSHVEHLVESAKLAVTGGRPHQQTDRGPRQTSAGGV